MPAVVHRPFELRTVSEFLRSVTQQPSGLVIEGEPGIGKTTLWLTAIEQARDFGYRVFSARVGQAESVLAYATVADLLRDIDATVLAGLPDIQRVAVDRVLLRASSEDHTTDQRVVAAAFASVFDCLAADSPVLSPSTICSGSIGPARMCWRSPPGGSRRRSGCCSPSARTPTAEAR